jgi:hypothetical protein
MAHPVDHEQRQHPRVVCRAPVRVSPIGEPAPRPALHLLAEDLSEAGLQLTSPEPFAVGKRLLLDIEVDEQSAEAIRAVGLVVWMAHAAHQERWRLGVVLVEVSDPTRERLRGLVAALGH